MRRIAALIVIPALAIVLTRTAAAQTVPSVDAGPVNSAEAGANDDLIRLGSHLLDNADLVRMGEGLLDKNLQGAKAKLLDPNDAGDAAGSDQADAGEGDANQADAGGDAGVDDAAEDDPGEDDVDEGDDGGDSGRPGDGGTRRRSGTNASHSRSDAGPGGPSAPAAAASTPPPPEPPPPPTGPLGFGQTRQERIEKGAELPMDGAEDSPLKDLGVPPAAIPAIATVATVGVMAIWPFLIKTFTGLFKGVIAALLKARAKKTKKIDAKARAFLVFGFRLRPAELGALLVAAVIYGLAVSYAFQGRKLQRGFVLRQEGLVLAIYYLRSMFRFAYERAYKLATQYKFWLGGAFLCLGSAYLGNTLGTVGFEIDGAKSPEDTKRMVKMKVWLIVVALVLAVGFCFANIHNPAKVLQSGRLMMSGTALAEILPIAPMPGQKIYRWRREIWVLLVVLVVPTFFLINFVL